MGKLKTTREWLKMIKAKFDKFFINQLLFMIFATLSLNSYALSIPTMSLNNHSKEKLMPNKNQSKTQKATFAGGCFWCMQQPFDKLSGVTNVTVGYTAGHTKNPTYEQVSSGGTGHSEAIEVIYDPLIISYEELLEVFWHNIDPTVKDRQFCDIGDQYRSELYFHNAEQKQVALASRKALLESKKLNNIETNITQAAMFYPAEEYHQDYYKKNPVRYKFYKYNCGREKKLKQIWG
jgi:peptide-methionine (S)-S-oxide reductase